MNSKELYSEKKYDFFNSKIKSHHTVIPWNGYGCISTIFGCSTIIAAFGYSGILLSYTNLDLSYLASALIFSFNLILSKFLVSHYDGLRCSGLT